MAKLIWLIAIITCTGLAAAASVGSYHPAAIRPGGGPDIVKPYT